MFADTTFTCGEHHTFKLHSTILSKKSTWFAQQYEIAACDQSHQFDLSSDGLRPAELDLLGLEACNTGHECNFILIFRQLLRFCYVEDYPHEAICKANVFTYALAKAYGIDSIPPHCVTGFAKAMEALEKDDTVFPHLVNMVYELFGADEDNYLLSDARKQVQAYAKAEITRLMTSLTTTFWHSKLTKAMPKATQDIMSRSFDPAEFELSRLLHNPSPSDEPDLFPERPLVKPKCACCLANMVALDMTTRTPDKKLCKDCNSSKRYYTISPFRTRAANVTLSI